MAILPAADLGVTETAPAAVAAGGEVDYTLEAINNGPSDATGMTLTDTLPAGVEFVSADAGCAEAAGVVTCAMGALANGTTAAYTVTVRAPYSLGDQTLTNTVVVDRDEGDLVSANDTDPGRHHGRPDPLGSAASHGCIRLDNAAVAWLAMRAREGTPARIRH